jgi:hypothetical protein
MKSALQPYLLRSSFSSALCISRTSIANVCICPSRSYVWPLSLLCLYLQSIDRIAYLLIGGVISTPELSIFLVRHSEVHVLQWPLGFMHIIKPSLSAILICLISHRLLPMFPSPLFPGFSSPNQSNAFESKSQGLFGIKMQLSQL